jgi:hypothetical protein
VRGKYAGRFTKNTIMVVLDPDVAAISSMTILVDPAEDAVGGREGESGHQY